MDNRLQKLIAWIRQSAAPAKGLLVPVSGGSDSALSFYLCSKAFPDKTVAVHAGEDLRCRSWFEAIGTVHLIAAPSGDDNPEIMRWAKFMSKSHKERRWLVGSRNRSEDTLGAYSLASRTATYLPIVGLWKSTIMELCKIIQVPDEVLISSRQADPDCGRPKELAEISLELIDVFLQVKAGELAEERLKDLTKEQIAYLETTYNANQFRGLLPTKGPQF